jgi:hypothetical protein
MTLADERVLLLKEQLTIEQAEGRAWNKKAEAFGRVIKMASLVQRPRDSDFELTYKEHRYQPFWHVLCRARYVYDRRRDFALTMSGPEVTAVTIEGQERQVTHGRIILAGVEHCREEPQHERFVDGVTSAADPLLAEYLKYPAAEIPGEAVATFAPAHVVVVPPQVKASTIVRQALVGIMKPLQADLILEDRLEVERVDLYYRPVYAFQYRWLSKDKETVVEFDAVTGHPAADGRTFQQFVGKILDPAFLFDVGVDTVDLLVPGGGLAIKIARKGLDVARSRPKGS